MGDTRPAHRGAVGGPQILEDAGRVMGHGRAIRFPAGGGVGTGGRARVKPLRIRVGEGGEGARGLGESANLPKSPNRTSSTLELLSDPECVDMRPYLIKVLAAIRRNWVAVIPESARFGRPGRVAIQIAISRSGNVDKLVIAMPSGAESLDRAAVAGISASNPLPPLPPEFKGGSIRLQFNFSYNAPR